MKKILIMILFLLSALLQEAMAQNRTVTGRVTDATNNEGLPGVTVLVKGTQVGTATDATGNYSINVPETGTTLVFSFVGYTTTERTIGNSTTINVAIGTDAKQLGEVVVTALGISREKAELGYAATSVTNEVVTRANPVNVANGLQGKVAGLNVMTTNSGVFENVRINLRGIRSITGNNNPLLVLDGVQSDINYLSSLNPNDIENVSVLKGASAAAIYGPDARNGVIVVTTKKGAVDKPVVTLSHSTQLQQVSFFPKFQTQFGSGGYGQYTAYENWSWGPAFDGSMVPIGKELPDGTTQMVPYSPRNDRKEFFNTGVVMQNDVSLAAKDFYISLQDANIKGVVPDDKNRRTGLRLNTGREYGKFRVGLNTNYIQQNYNVYNAELQDEHFTRLNTGSNEGLMNLIFNTPAHIPLTSYKDFENNPYAQYNNYFNDYGLNPYWAIDNWRLEGKREDVITNMDLNFKATDWLSLTYRGGMIARFTNERGTSAGETPNEYGLGRSFDIVTGSVEERSYRNTRLSSEAFANFNKQLTDDFKVTGILGTYVRQDDTRDTRVGAGTLVVPELFNISNLAGQLTGTSPQTRSRLFSVYASAGLNYKWASVEFTGRQDRTSVLGMDNNSYFYPGVNVALRVSDMIGALKDNSAISFVKLRGSWNKTANADIAPYSLAGTFSRMYGFPYGNLAGFTANNTTYDADLSPEFIKSTEFGIETAFLNNRLSLEATYYHQDNTDQIIPIRVSEATGFGFANVNAASFINQGFELETRLTPLVNLGGVNINFNANATYSDTEIKSVYEGLNEIAITGGYTIASNYAIVGQPAFILKSNDYLRDDQGRIIVDKYSGYPTEDPTLKPFGRTLPKWIVGLNPSVEWKGLTFSALAEYKGGHVAYHGIGPGMAWTGVSAATARNNRERFVIPNSVIENEDGSFTPNTNVAITNPNDFYIGVFRDVFSNFITSAASWRLREVALSYALPTSLVSRQNVIKGVSVALTARNLAIWLPKTNEFSDPDFSSFGASQIGVTATQASNSTGITSSQINPPVRTFGGNVTLTF